MLMDNLDVVMLAMDELVDGGYDTEKYSTI